MFEKGNTYGKGRPPGSLNRRKVVDIVKDALGGKEIIAEMMRLAGNNPKAQMDVLRELLPYCYPKLAPIEATQDEQVSPEDAKKITSAEYMEELRRIREEEKKSAESA